MSAVNLGLGIVLLLLALVLVIPGILATAGKLPGNSVFGLRVAEVRKDKATWDQAHRVAGPLWIFAGVALAFAAAFAFIASGWVWLAPVVFVVAAVIGASVAGNFGARAAVLVDAARTPHPEEGCASSLGQADAADSAPAPQVNLDALRKAAGRADENR